MEIDDYTPAGSLEEAKKLFSEALEAEDFERADFYQDEIEEFKNYNEVLQNAKNIHNYIQGANDMDNQMTIVQDQLYDNIIKQRDSDIAKFNKQFFEIKARQKQELIELLNRWTIDREKQTNDSQEEYKRTLDTAKILVRQSKIKEAIIMRDKAREMKNKADTIDRDEFDRQYEKLCLAMEVRHRTELDNFMESRREAMQKYDIMIEKAYDEKDRQFMIENSNAVIATAGKYPVVNPAPQSLSMQTVNYQKDIVYISRSKNEL
ncbi:hypothetical protein TVAG_119780 [Trichomonas vaginalis G3]|uniref:Uncharacterized protein n=1 Tax=Trichomonas vaginalis (strain ATCC PRA-98 / G3) TaxID=412133 RepID=A2D7C4_TRIV3|nr:hypothetical protein TVAGG3_0992650 [Trichomonas vaginalis G3]EAY23641.1 hypothetical protein TVAG_119780 [Trichomonas vaginalis G3]KAI5490133.1 hypothetical protein TVAGG3_0992650 [Trichomonas vaginalis G3]|eukprot:XP_001276889.1 hypothetical protein [Trichomonas vaginalis G3]